MILPMNPVAWRDLAENLVSATQALCALRKPRYRSGARNVSSSFVTQRTRGIKCANQQFLRQSPWYSGFRPVTAHWTNGPRNASQPVRRLGRLALCCWMATRSKAPLSVALLVDSPARTGSFGSNRSVSRNPECAIEPSNSFISPLLNPLRASVWGSFSCAIAAKPALFPVIGSIKGETHV